MVVVALALLAAVLAFGTGLAVGHRRGRAARAERRWLRRHDRVTGLLSREDFCAAADQVVAAVRRPEDAVAVAVLHLQHLDDVNDALGHAVADQVLREVSQRLLEAVPLGGLVGRVGGSRLALTLHVGPDAEQLRPRLTGLRDALAEEVDVDGLPVVIESLVGVAVSRGEEHDDAAELLRRADLASRRADAEGGVALSDAGTDQVDPGRLSLVAELRRALAHDELRLHYQPLVDPRSGRTAGVEALVRWQHPRRGLLGPGEFLPVLERTGLIDDLTAWTLREATRQLVAWGPAAEDVSVSVNVSGRSVSRTLPDVVADALHRSGLAPSRLVVEVTETAAVRDPATSVWALGRLAANGVRVALDDFGKGQTSLGLLRRLPIEELKVDGSFVGRMVSSRHDAAVVSALVRLGHDLGLHVVAEGVEDDATADQVVALGCDLLQGFGLSRPLPPERLPDLLRGPPLRTPAAVQVPVARHGQHREPVR